MSVSVAILSTAHVHAPSFVACCQKDPRAQVVGVWDDNQARGEAFASQRGLAFVADRDALIAQADAVVICSENIHHGTLIAAGIAAGKHVMCEKPIAATAEEAAKIAALIPTSDKVLMTSFPCPFSPVWRTALNRVRAGEIGKVVAINATNQGTCPFGWFVEPELSGGGAMIDHVVHVADLINRLLGPTATKVQAQIGSNIYGQKWEDTAMVTIRYSDGTFATIDSSWSKPAGYKTWGNVKITLVGEKGVMELDLFNQGLDVYRTKHDHFGAGANLDALMVGEFLDAIEQGRAPEVTLSQGLDASHIALAAYESVRSGGQAVAVRAS